MEAPGTRDEGVPNSWRISDLVQRTGTSKELIHHYLRQGLLPASVERGRYAEQHERLLRQIRLLREEHYLPLEVIRRVFEVFGFDPDRIEVLTLSESLGRRMELLGTSGNLVVSETFSATELAGAAGIGAERLADYREARLIAPTTNGSDERYAAADANVVALCEHGTTLGIPFDSFRTIASYVRVAFELEQGVFFGGAGAGENAANILTDLFVRREVATSFVGNVLSALLQRRFREVLDPPDRSGSLDDVIYQPSPVFVARHRLEEALDEAREQLGQCPDLPQRWLRFARLLIHAGRYREAVFFLGEARERWPDDTALSGAHGRALVLLGDLDRGLVLLRAVTGDPLAAVYAAVATYRKACAEDRPEALLRVAAPVLDGLEGALAAANRLPGPDRVKATALGGWLLAALPPMFANPKRGRALLVEALDSVGDEYIDEPELPGWRDRWRLNAAYLLFDCLGREPAPAGDGPAPHPTRDALRSLICRLDPGSALAQAAYLSPDPSPQRGRKHP